LKINASARTLKSLALTNGSLNRDTLAGTGLLACCKQLIIRQDWFTDSRPAQYQIMRRWLNNYELSIFFINLTEIYINLA